MAGDKVERRISLQDVVRVARSALDDPTALVLSYRLLPYSADKLGFSASHLHLDVTYQASRGINLNNNSTFYDALSKSAAAPGFTPLCTATTQLPGYEGNHLPISQQIRHGWTFGSQRSLGDRFIPRKRGVSLGASRYLLVTHDGGTRDGVFLDVFAESKRVIETWRRQLFEKSLQRLEPFRGVQSKRVLNFGEPESYLERRDPKLCEFGDESQWECRPRTKPLMSVKGENSKGYRDHGAQIFRFAKPIKLKNLIDWSQKNSLAVVLGETVCISAVDSNPRASKMLRIDYNTFLCCVKWDKKGHLLAMSGFDGNVSLFDSASVEIKWTVSCICYKEAEPKNCRTYCMAWAKNDQHLITACTHGSLLVLNTTDGSLIDSRLSSKEIIAISVCPKDQYVVVSKANHLVKLLDYPTFVPIFEIQFYSPVMVFAWHPWQSGILCIGGGPGDASISLWNVNSRRQLGIRKVKFVGSVDSMLFNQLSGELLVHWYYLENDRLHSKIVVLSSLESVVDVVPIRDEHKMINIVWSPDHTKLVTQHRDTVVIWNFFGDEADKWQKVRKVCPQRDPNNNLRNYGLDSSTTGPYASVATARRGKSFSNFIIR